MPEAQALQPRAPGWPPYSVGAPQTCHHGSDRQERDLHHVAQDQVKGCRKSPRHVGKDHCAVSGLVLDGAARYLEMAWPRHIGGAVVFEEGALAHGRTEKKNLSVPSRDASRPSCAAQGSARRLRELWGAEAAAPRLQSLRLLRWAGSRSRRQGATGRGPGLRPGRGMSVICA